MHCKIRDKSSQAGCRDVFIPRISLYPKNVEQFGFEWSRRQFPVCPAFAMTVNASQASDCAHWLLNIIYALQGQTLKQVGVWLVSSPCFTHGQLYVAASRFLCLHLQKIGYSFVNFV